MLRGIDPQTEGKVSELPRDIIRGKFDLSGRGLLVGKDFATACIWTLAIACPSIRSAKSKK